MCNDFAANDAVNKLLSCISIDELLAFETTSAPISSPLLACISYVLISLGAYVTDVDLIIKLPVYESVIPICPFQSSIFNVTFSNTTSSPFSINKGADKIASPLNLTLRLICSGSRILPCNFTVLILGLSNCFCIVSETGLNILLPSVHF